MARMAQILPLHILIACLEDLERVGVVPIELA
jgi:hypothetical protein